MVTTASSRSWSPRLGARSRICRASSSTRCCTSGTHWLCNGFATRSRVEIGRWLDDLRDPTASRAARGILIHQEQGDYMDDRTIYTDQNDPSAGGRDTATGTDPDANYEPPRFECKT